MADTTKHPTPPEMKCPHCGNVLPKPKYKAPPEPPKDQTGKPIPPPDGKHAPKAFTRPYCGKTINPSKKPENRTT